MQETALWHCDISTKSDNVNIKMLKYVLSLVLWLVVNTTANRECDHLGVLVYEDMNCKPIIKGSDKCPSKFKCPQLQHNSEDLCYFRNNTYGQGEMVNSNETYCKFGCICDGPKNSKAFTCAIAECLQFGPPLPEECYYKYTFASCCGSRTCPTEPIHKCMYDNEEYKEGERFFPKNSCSMCICQKGFNGVIEKPYCIPRQCEGQLRFQKEIKKFCAPVYRIADDIQNGILCCPSEYICPDGKEIITGSPTSGNECRYGNETIKVGQGFKKNVDRWRNATCECKIPPLVTCVLDELK